MRLNHNPSISSSCIAIFGILYEVSHLCKSPAFIVNKTIAATNWKNVNENTYHYLRNLHRLYAPFIPTETYIQ